MTAIAIRDLSFRWERQARACLQVPHLDVEQGDSLFVHGPSGSGKSTLLSLMTGVMTPNRGSLAILGRNLADMGAAQRDRFRADHVGYIFQQFNLLPYLSVLRNVVLPCRISSRRAKRARADGGVLESAMGLLETLGIGPELWDRDGASLSVGQQQRVAAARALIGRPELIVADEPTSALDVPRRDAFMHLLLAACGRAGSTLVLVSHDERLATHFGRSLDLLDINRAASEATG